METKYPNILFYSEWWYAIKELPPEQQRAALVAVMEYAFEGREPTDVIIRVATALMRSTIDHDKEKYAETCEKRRQGVVARWQRQKQALAELEQVKKNTHEYLCIDKYSSYTDNDNDNDNDNGELLKNNSLSQKDARATRERESQDFNNDFSAANAAQSLPRQLLTQKPKTMEKYCNAIGITAAQFVAMGEETLNDWEAAGTVHTSDARRTTHLLNTIRRKAQEAAKSQPSAAERRRKAAETPRPPEPEKPSAPPQTAADYIRSKGYDPTKVSLVQLNDDEWRRTHPPNLPH